VCPLLTRKRKSNEKIEELFFLLRGTRTLQDPADILFIKKKYQDWTDHVQFVQVEITMTNFAVSVISFVLFLAGAYNRHWPNFASLSWKMTPCVFCWPAQKITIETA
jgi:hypothetical protein